MSVHRTFEPCHIHLVYFKFSHSTPKYQLIFTLSTFDLCFCSSKLKFSQSISTMSEHLILFPSIPHSLILSVAHLVHSTLTVYTHSVHLMHTAYKPQCHSIPFFLWPPQANIIHPRLSYQPSHGPIPSSLPF